MKTSVATYITQTTSHQDKKKNHQNNRKMQTLFSTPHKPPEPAPRKHRPSTTSTTPISSSSIVKNSVIGGNSNNREHYIVSARRISTATASSTTASSSIHKKLSFAANDNNYHHYETPSSISSSTSSPSNSAAAETSSNDNNNNNSVGRQHQFIVSNSKETKQIVVAAIDGDDDDREDKDEQPEDIQKRQFFSPHNLSPRNLLKRNDEDDEQAKMIIETISFSPGGGRRRPNSDYNNHNNISPSSTRRRGNNFSNSNISNNSQQHSTGSHYSPYLQQQQLVYSSSAPSPPPSHNRLKEKFDPRPFVLGLPKQTDFSVRKSQYAENTAELKRRSDQGALIGEEMDERSEMICQWCAGAHYIAEDVFGDDEISVLNSSRLHYMTSAEELYFRQLSALRLEVETEQAREHRKLVFELRRDIFVLSRSVRAHLRKFISDWSMIRAAKILIAQMKRDNMREREVKVRNDILRLQSTTAGDLMMKITIELCDITKMRLAAFLFSMRRGFCSATLCKLEVVERHDIMWGNRVPHPPEDLFYRVVRHHAPMRTDVMSYIEIREDFTPEDYTEKIYTEEILKLRTILLSLQCAEIAHRDAVFDEELFERDQLTKQVQRSHLESYMLIEKRVMFHEQKVFMVDEFLPRSSAILQYHHRRDIEKEEFETRTDVVEIELLKECAEEIQKSIDDWRKRAQLTIIRCWTAHVNRREFRQKQLDIFKEILRQERECESQVKYAELNDEYCSVAAREAIEQIIEPQFRFGIQEPAWQESLTQTLLVQYARLVRQSWFEGPDYWATLGEIPDRLRAMVTRFENECESMLIDAEQELLDVSSEEAEKRRDLFEQFELHRRLKSKLDELEQEAIKE